MITSQCSLRGFEQLPLVAVSLLGSVTIWPLAAMAQTSNFGEVTLSGGGTQVEVDGFTAGFYGLSNIANRDRNGDLCLGYADSTPDHVLNLQQDFGQLMIIVDSNGADTTLLIQGPDDNTVRCNDNADRQSRDAAIEDNFQAGIYRVWVGAFKQGERRDYRLIIRE